MDEQNTNYQQPPQYQQNGAGQSYGQQPPQYQQPYGQGQPPQKPDSYLVWAILTTVLCCLPFGIVAIVKAARVDGLYNGGQYAAAQQASDDAKKWSIIAAVVGIVVGIVYGFSAAALGLAV